MMEEELTTIELDVVAEILEMKTLKPCLGNFEPDKIEYNSRYKTFDFFAKKFPTGWEYIPGFEKVIEMCQFNSFKTPLMEMESRQNVNVTVSE